MRKIIVLIFCLSVFSVFTSAQAYEGKIDYDKKKQDALIIEFTYPPEAVEGAFVQIMEKQGFRAKEEKGLFNRDKGFILFNNSLISEITDRRMDYIINVERKSRREKDESVLYLIISKDGKNAMGSLSNKTVSNAKKFLNNLLPEVEAFNLELMIKDQEDVVAKAEKKLKELRDDQESMEKKIKNLQDDLKKNEKDQDDAQKEIVDQKLALEALKGKRKNN